MPVTLAAPRDAGRHFSITLAIPRSPTQPQQAYHLSKMVYVCLLTISQHLLLGPQAPPITNSEASLITAILQRGKLRLSLAKSCITRKKWSWD